MRDLRSRYSPDKKQAGVILRRVKPKERNITRIDLYQLKIFNVARVSQKRDSIVNHSRELIYIFNLTGAGDEIVLQITSH